MSLPVLPEPTAAPLPVLLDSLREPGEARARSLLPASFIWSRRADSSREIWDFVA